ncbi:MAG: hypothetical protein SFV22_20615 [Saprospiraceae bacterium]|nr:hypothetical protein [Saprospiraceae bacterium]
MPFFILANTKFTVMHTNRVSYAIQMIDESCHPDEARETLNDFMDARSLQHNIRITRNWERNHRFDSKQLDNKIKEVRAQYQQAKALLEEAKKKGFAVEIKANIELKMLKNSPDNAVETNNFQHTVESQN